MSLLEHDIPEVRADDLLDGSVSLRRDWFGSDSILKLSISEGSKEMPELILKFLTPRNAAFCCIRDHWLWVEIVKGVLKSWVAWLDNDSVGHVFFSDLKVFSELLLDAILDVGVGVEER